MNPTLQKELDKLCSSLAAKHSTTEKLVNLIIQVKLITSKLGIIATFAKSNTISVQESINNLTHDVTNLTLVGAALAGFQPNQTDKVMALYTDVHNAVEPLLSVYYKEAANQGKAVS